MFISDEDIEAGLYYLRENAATAAKATAERKYLEGFSKPLLALIKADYPLLSEAGREREALADPRYLKHLEALRIAIEEDELHKYRVESFKATLAAWQTMNKVELAMKI